MLTFWTFKFNFDVDIFECFWTGQLFWLLFQDNWANFLQSFYIVNDVDAVKSSLLVFIKI